MKPTKKIYMPRLMAACAAVIIMGLFPVAYAADIGGIQLWINGDQTDAVLDIQGTSYTVTYQDQDGTSHEFGGGGVAFNRDGSERPLTEAEIMEQLDSPDVQYREDGSVWVCYHNAETEITDRFDEDGVCYVQLKTDSGDLGSNGHYRAEQLCVLAASLEDRPLCFRCQLRAHQRCINAVPVIAPQVRGTDCQFLCADRQHRCWLRGY